MANERGSRHVRRHDRPPDDSFGITRGGVGKKPGRAERAQIAQERLLAHPISASLARRNVGRMLTAWGRADLLDCAQLIVTELVANAVQATAEAAAAQAGAGRVTPGGPVESPRAEVGVGLYRTRGRVVLEVWDCSPLPPRLAASSVKEVGGRGLILVNALAVAWGYRWPLSGGKVVYAILNEVT